MRRRKGQVGGGGAAVKHRLCVNITTLIHTITFIMAVVQLCVISFHEPVHAGTGAALKSE